MLGYIAENLLTGFTQNVQWHEVPALTAAGATLLDVRTRTEFAAGALPSAINIPLDDLRERIAELPATPLIVYCQVGQRGHTATVLLRERGMDAVNLDGGYRTWVASQEAQPAVTARL